MYSKKIVILENQNLTKYLVDRLDFKNNYNGFYIECWNLLPIIDRDIFKRYNTMNINSKNKFINILSLGHLLKSLINIKKKNFFYFNNCGINLIATIVDIIFYLKGGKKVLIRPTEHDLKIKYLDRIKQILNINLLFFLRRILIFFLNQLSSKFLKMITPKPAIIFVGNNFLYKKLNKIKTNVFKFNCPEYEKYYNTKIKKEKKYVVYIDQDIIRSFEQSITNVPKVILREEEYEKELSKTLRDIENSKIFKQYPLKIAAHPRRRKKFNLLNKRPIFDQTFKLISKAKVVIAHHSLAIKYAILFDKPIILLNAKKYFNSEGLAEVDFLKNNLNLITLDISNDNKRMISKIKKVSPDKKKYKKFKDEYISFPNYEKKKRWKEISNKLKTLN